MQMKIGKWVLNINKQDNTDADMYSVKRVLNSFKDMGATEDQLEDEKLKLIHNEKYLYSWLKTIKEQRP